MPIRPGEFWVADIPFSSGSSSKTTAKRSLAKSEATTPTGRLDCLSRRHMPPPSARPAGPYGGSRHSRTTPSWPPDTALRPSGETATPQA